MTQINFEASRARLLEHFRDNRTITRIVAKQPATLTIEQLLTLNCVLEELIDQQQSASVGPVIYQEQSHTRETQRTEFKHE